MNVVEFWDFQRNSAQSSKSSIYYPISMSRIQRLHLQLKGLCQRPFSGWEFDKVEILLLEIHPVGSGPEETYMGRIHMGGFSVLYTDLL